LFYVDDSGVKETASHPLFTVEANEFLTLKQLLLTLKLLNYAISAIHLISSTNNFFTIYQTKLTVYIDQNHQIINIKTIN